MASCFCAVNSYGNVIIYHTYRNDVDKETVLDVFRSRVLLENNSKRPPVFVEGGWTYTYISEHNVYLLMVSAINCLPLMQLEFLRHCVRTWSSYFLHVTEKTIRDNFVIIYELLDEMGDFGYPQLTEEKLLKSFITQEGVLSFFVAKHDALATKIPEAVTKKELYPWRPRDKVYKYKKNEIFLDIVEKISTTIDRDGSVLSHEVTGVVNARSYLSGMPVMELLMKNNIPSSSGYRYSSNDAFLNMEGIQFHECVELTTFQEKQKIRCVPPDGSFTLCNYWTTLSGLPPIKISCVQCSSSSFRITMEWRLWANTELNSYGFKNVEVLFPVPCDAHSFQVLHSSCGTCTHNASLNKIVWKISRTLHQLPFSIRFKYDVPSIRCKENEPGAAAGGGEGPVEIQFEGSYAPSGVSIEKLEFKENTIHNFHATGWVRYVAKNGKYYFPQSSLIPSRSH